MTESNNDGDSVVQAAATTTVTAIAVSRVAVATTYQKQEVLWLQITMRHVMLVTILNRLKQNERHITRFLFIVVTLLHNPIKELSAHHFLCHEVVIVLFFKRVVEADNVGML